MKPFIKKRNTYNKNIREEGIFILKNLICKKQTLII